MEKATIQKQKVDQINDLMSVLQSNRKAMREFISIASNYMDVSYYLTYMTYVANLVIL